MTVGRLGIEAGSLCRREADQAWARYWVLVRAGHRRRLRSVQAACLARSGLYTHDCLVLLLRAPGPLPYVGEATE